MNKFSMKAAATLAVLGGMMASAVTASAALNLPTMNCSYSFSTNMKLGSRGTEVKNLQKVLNMYPQTQVAFDTNAGAPGYETDYFGELTLRAANKFHALHLVELGISAPTGNVFSGTRALLNMVCSGSTGTATLPAGCTTASGYSPINGAKCDSLQGNGGSNSTLPAGCTSTSGFSPTTGQSCSSTGTPSTTGPVSVMLSSSQPTGQLVQTQSGARLADFTFTGNGTVTNIQLERTGISTDSTLTNVYLYDGNTRITDAASVVTGGAINFNAPNGIFVVSGSRTITVRADIAASTSGQTVGVKLNSVTSLGGSASTYSNVMGNQLQIGSVTTATVNFSTIIVADTTVDAGTTNYNVWSGSASIGTRDVSLRAATFKFVGSAPVDALANLSLYVDGTKVAGPALINAANNNKITFDLGSNPYLLRTGTHTFDVRADIEKGSNRTISISVENVADLMFEDTGLTGVNVSPTVANSALTQSNSTYRTITVNSGSVTVNTDAAFTANKVTGGATNVPVGQFTLKAYGEDVKVNSLQVTFATTTINTLNNVSVYVNGGQVSTSQNFSGPTLTYNLGSSLVIPAGQTVTLTVKADIVNTSNAAYTSGTIAAKIGGTTNNAQGQSSYELVSVASSQVTSNVLTVSSGSGTFARTAGFVATTVAPNSSNVKIGSFTLQANSSEALKVNSIGVNPAVSGYAQTNVSNLKVQLGSTVLGTPVGNPATGTTTFSFNDITVPANGTVSFDVYADIGSATTGSTTAAMQVTYRGDVSNTTTTESAAGVAVTSSASTLSNSTLSSASPVSQFVVGGQTFGVATFKVSTASAGTNATVRELRFTTTGTDAIESITVGSATSSVISGGTTTVAGLNISVSSNGTDIPVTVKFAQFQNNAQNQSGSRTSGVGTVNIKLGHVEATSGSGSVITNTTVVASNNMTLVGSKPTITVPTGNTNQLILGAENKVGEYTVTADANGRIQVASTSISLTAVNVSTSTYTSGRIADGNTTIPNSTVDLTTASGTAAISFTTPYDIAAGTSKTFSLYAVVNGTQASNGTPYVASRLTSGATFKFVDVIGGNTTYDGSLIYNFPTNSYTTKTN